MTAPYDTGEQYEGGVAGGGGQWADFGVNVGHAVYGDIHIHPAAPADLPARTRTAPPGRRAEPGHASVRAAVVDLVRACERAVAALSSAALTRWEGRDDDID
ncbi:MULTISPECIES: hypothetical protein [unclassified Streptomyces]|uniref:hypothetical protein n=1 Tax=unclassified Streptomyces TaxID=2593676 RepID=UPI0006F98EFD|nr:MULTISPECIES: hypothetical protein [unclassified Streptomyces]KQX50817.1 hypothetical protein ASD33_12335 [Streptomyces sp. Root1304]KRA84982.1 hypothetical protein ASE09_12340 [Streptomyces sp. Root66D1]